MTNAKAPLHESSSRAVTSHDRYQLLEEVYRAFQEHQISLQAQGGGSAPDSHEVSGAGAVAGQQVPKGASRVLTASMWKSEALPPCCSYEACCLLELYRPLLTPQDLILADVRVGLEHIPLLVVSVNFGLLLLALNPDTPEELKSDFSYLLQQERQLRRLKQDLVSTLSRHLKLGLEQAIALQESTLVLICLASCQVSDIVQQVLPQLRHYPRPREAMRLKALFTDKDSEVRLRYLKKGAFAQVEKLLQQRYPDLTLGSQSVIAAQGSSSSSSSSGANASGAAAAHAGHASSEMSAKSPLQPVWLMLPVPESGRMALPQGAFVGSFKGATEESLFAHLRWPEVASPRRFLAKEQLTHLRKLILPRACSFQPLPTTRIVALSYAANEKDRAPASAAPLRANQSAPVVELHPALKERLLALDGFQLGVILSFEPMLFLGGVFGSGRSMVLIARALYMYMQWHLQTGRAQPPETMQGLERAAAGSEAQHPLVLILYAHAQQGLALQRCLQHETAHLHLPLGDFLLQDARHHLSLLQAQAQPAGHGSAGAEPSEEASVTALPPRCSLLLVDEIQELTVPELQLLYDYHQPHACVLSGDFCYERWPDAIASERIVKPQGLLPHYVDLLNKWREALQRRSQKEPLFVLPELRPESKLLTMSEQQLLSKVFLPWPEAKSPAGSAGPATAEAAVAAGAGAEARGPLALLPERMACVRLLPLTYRGAPLLTSLVLKYQLQYFAPANIGFDLRELCDNLTALEDLGDDGYAEGEVVNSYTRQALERMNQQNNTEVPVDGSFSALRSWVQGWSQKVQAQGNSESSARSNAHPVDPCGQVSWLRLNDTLTREQLWPQLLEQAQSFCAAVEPLWTLPLLSSSPVSHPHRGTQWACLSNEPLSLVVLDFALRHSLHAVACSSALPPLEELIGRELKSLLQSERQQGRAAGESDSGALSSLVVGLSSVLEKELKREQTLGQNLRAFGAHLQHSFQRAPQGQRYLQLWQQGLRILFSKESTTVRHELMAQITLLSQKLERAQAPLAKIEWSQLSQMIGAEASLSALSLSTASAPYRAILWTLALYVSEAFIATPQSDTARDLVWRDAAESPLEHSMWRWQLRLMAPQLLLRLTKLVAAAFLSAYIPEQKRLFSQMVKAYGPQDEKLVAQMCLRLSQILRPNLLALSSFGESSLPLSAQSSTLYLSTIEAFQGLESEHALVLLLPVKEREESFPLSAAQRAMPAAITPSLVYSAITRARSQLRIVHQVPVLAEHLEPLLQQVHEDMMALREEAQAPATESKGAEDSGDSTQAETSPMIFVGVGRIS